MEQGKNTCLAFTEAASATATDAEQLNTEEPGAPEDIPCREIRRKKKKRKKKNLRRRFLIALVLVVACAIFLASPVFNIKTVTVSGNVYYTDEEVVNMSGAVTGRNLVFCPGKKEIRKRLLQDPYFAKVKVKRHLPSALEIRVTERKQVAAIIYGNRYIVIDEEGRVLRIARTDPKLTTLSGLTLSRIRIGKTVRAEEKETLKETLEMVSTMSRGDLYFKKIKVQKRTIRAYVYDTLIVKGTPEQMKKAIDSGNLQKVINKLYQNKTKRGTISLGEHNYISFSPSF